MEPTSDAPSRIPRLRALGVEFGCLLKRLDRLLHLPRIVERDSAIAIGLRRIRRIQFGALFVRLHRFRNLPSTPVDAAQIVVISRRRLQFDGLLIGVDGVVGPAVRVIGVAESRPDQI